MNTENTKSRSKLEQLSPEQQEMLVELAKRGSLVDLAESLKEHGIDTSDSALSRFLKKKRASILVEDGKELAASAAALAEQGRGGKLREGTLEVLRQKFFEKAAGGQSAEEARELYDALVKEEGRLKELELEGRKVCALEQQVKLQERRIEVEAMKARALLGRVKAEVVETKALGTGEAGKVRDQGEAPKVGDEGVERKVAGVPAEGETTCGAVANGRGDGVANEAGNEHANDRPHERAKRELGGPGTRFVELVEEALAILNRGGDPGERILTARALLAEAVAETVAGFGKG